MRTEVRREKTKRPFPWKVAFPLLLLAGTAAYLGTGPVRQERFLRQASLSRLQEAARGSSDNPRVWYYLGLRLQQTGQKAAAAAALEHAAALSDGEDIYLAWAAAVPSAQANMVLTSFLARHPNSAAAHFALARLFRQTGDQTHSYEEAFQAARLDASDPRIWSLYGDSALATGHSPEAADAYRHSLALNPKEVHDSIHDHIGLGAALLALNRRPEGLTSLQAAAALAPDDGAVQAAIGSALVPDAETPADLETARRYLQSGLRLRPDLDAVSLPLGECSLKQKRWAEAVAELTRAQARTPDDPETAFALAQAYRGAGNPARAAEALRRHEQLESYQTERASLLLRAGQTANGDTHLKLARLAASHGIYQTAVAEYQNALAQAPSDARIAQELTVARQKAGVR